MKSTTPNRFLTTAALTAAVAAGVSVPVHAETSAPARQAKALPGYEVVQATVTATSPSTLRGPGCSEGKVVVGGGVQVEGPQAVVMASIPGPLGKGWLAQARQIGQDTVTFTVRAICVNAAAAPGYQIINQSASGLPNFGTATAACPADKVILGGGSQAVGANAALRVSTAPKPKSPGYFWSASAHSVGEKTVGLNVRALCSSPIPGYELVTLPFARAPHLTRRTVACPAGKALLSGGIGGYNSAIITTATVEPFDPALGHRWTTAIREIGTPDSGSELTAICAQA